MRGAWAGARPDFLAGDGACPARRVLAFPWPGRSVFSNPMAVGSLRPGSWHKRGRPLFFL